MKTFKKWVEENPDKTMWGMSWSLYWRGMVIFAGGYFEVVLVVVLLFGLLD